MGRLLLERASWVKSASENRARPFFRPEKPARRQTDDFTDMVEYANMGAKSLLRVHLEHAGALPLADAEGAAGSRPATDGLP
jgi:hypothetical protein